MKYLVILLFLLGFGYVLMPAGQTVLFATYYSDDRRNSITEYYRDEFQKLYCSYFMLFNPFCYIKPLKINHSPNLASIYLAPKQKSTYLEEYFYPLKDSFIVNGYEPYDEKGKAFGKLSEPLMLDGKQYNSEVTMKFYSSSLFGRIFIYLLIWVSIFFQVILFKKIMKKHE